MYAVTTVPNTFDNTFHVLHVDDDPQLSELTSIYFEREDDRFAVETATSASEGLDRLADKRFDCIISDYDMPGYNGIEFLEMVREENPDLPFILYTGKGTEEIASDAISAGVTDYQQKEAGTDQYTVLANLVSNAIEHYRSVQMVEQRDERLQDIVTRVTDALVEVDADWEFTFVNQQAEELYEMDQEYLLGRNFWGVFSEALDTRFETEYRQVMESREPTSFVEYFSQLDGWFDIEAYPKDDGGIAFYFVEVTEQKERERRYNAIFNQTYQFTGLLEPDGTLIEANETALEFGGLDRDDVIGKKMWNAYWFQHSKTTRTRAEEAVQRAADGEFVRHELPVQGADGDVIIDFSVRPITNEQGEVTLLVPEGRNITELKQREQELEKRTNQLQDIIDTVEAALWIRNKDNEYEFMNQFHRDLFDIADDVDITGKEFTDLLPEEVAEQFRVNDQHVYATGEPIEIEETVETDDGPRDYLTRIVPLFDNGSVYATCGIATDITEQKARERQLEQFASIVSHDLRNPLRVAEGNLELALEECDSEHLANIERAHSRMELLIDDLLTLAREGEGIGVTTAVDLDSLVGGCWANVEAAGSTLRADIGRTVQADESRLEQVIENLIRNAIEHGGEDVTVNVGALQNGFFVEDDGSGIPPEVREEVFEAGYSTTENGTGFGLSIVREIVNAHNWALRVTEGADGGARFEITEVEFASE